MIIPTRKFERFILNIYFSYILIFYPLINILYSSQQGFQNANRLFLVVIMGVTFVFYMKNKSYKRLRIIDLLIILVSFYITSSLLLFYSYATLSTPDLLRELLYTVLPFFVYLMSISVGYRYQNYSIRLIVTNLIIVVIIGIVIYFNLNPVLFGKTANALKEKNVFLWQFSSIYGAIIMGYLSQLMYALVLFGKYQGKYKKAIMAMFLTISILTLQRSSFIGIIMSTIIYFIFLPIKHNKKAIGEFVELMLIIVFVLFLLVSVIDRLDILNYNLSNQIISKFNNIKLENVVSDRQTQAIIYNDNNFLNILFGEGFGKYSPNNSAAISIQPDASYYRIYNELGLVGSILFFSIFLYFLVKGFKKKDPFMIYFILFTLIAFYFNRVVWAIPCNYIIFMLLGFSETDRYQGLNKNLYSKSLHTVKARGYVI